MAYTPTGKHLIAGNWIATGYLRLVARHGLLHTFLEGTPALVDQGVKAAEEAFETFAYSTREERAAFLDAILRGIDARGDSITEIGSQETACRGPPDRRAWRGDRRPASPVCSAYPQG